jgi:hypothetical protein
MSWASAVRTVTPQYRQDSVRLSSDIEHPQGVATLADFIERV